MLSLKKIKEILFRIEQRVPYIPDFSDGWNILKIMLVSFLICFVYSFSEVTKASDFYIVFWINLKLFSPYVIMQLLLLIFNAKIIKKLKPISSILYIIFLNFICVYLIYATLTRSFETFFNQFDETLAKFGLSFGIIFFFLIYFDWREKNLHPAQLQAQLSFLQSKMRPHFLFNTLNSIVSLIKKEPDIAKKMLLNLSELLRASLKEDNNFMHSMNDEIILCKKYLEIEKMRLSDRLNVSWNIQEGLENIRIPKLSIQPLIENSILHGIQNLENGGVVEISIRKNLLNKAIIEIKNPISNSNNETIKESKDHNNISMKNILERLKICFDENVVFKTKNDGESFYVILEIPIIFDKNKESLLQF